MEHLAIEAFKNYIYSYMYSKNNLKYNKQNIEDIKGKLINSFGFKEVPFIKLKNIDSKNNS